MDPVVRSHGMKADPPGSKYECFLMSGWWDILHLSCFNVKLWSNSTNGTKLQTDERTDERKDENYIPLGINAGGIIRWFFFFFFLFNQVISSSSPTTWPSFKPLAQIRFEISCWQDFVLIFSKGHNSRKGDNSDMKKPIQVNYFFMRNPYMKFQNPSMHSSYGMACSSFHSDFFFFKVA